MDDPQPTPPRRHPIFSRIVDVENQVPTGAIDAMTERKVRQAREDGYFDNLPGAGKPIPDIDKRRRPGWWADRFVAQERKKLKALRLDEALRKEMPALWRLPTETAVRAKVEELNDEREPSQHLDLEATLATWLRLQT